jgi:hypothetical protein
MLCTFEVEAAKLGKRANEQKSYPNDMSIDEIRFDTYYVAFKIRTEFYFRTLFGKNQSWVMKRHVSGGVNVPNSSGSAAAI